MLRLCCVRISKCYALELSIIVFPRQPVTVGPRTHVAGPLLLVEWQNATALSLRWHLTTGTLDSQSVQITRDDNIQTSEPLFLRITEKEATKKGKSPAIKFSIRQILTQLFRRKLSAYTRLRARQQNDISLSNVKMRLFYAMITQPSLHRLVYSI
jgi:hypothetical protein